jgi:hypothetical protein
MKMKTTTDEVMQLTRGSDVRRFTYEEWTCTRYMWIATGQKLGPIAAFFSEDAGAIPAEGIGVLRTILESTSAHLLAKPLGSWIKDGGSAGLELFTLVTKVWRLPYRHVTDSSDTVRVGGKKVADWGAAEAPVVPTLGEVKPFREAFDKLVALSGDGAMPLEFLAIGPRYLAQRR